MSLIIDDHIFLFNHLPSNSNQSTLIKTNNLIKTLPYHNQLNNKTFELFNVQNIQFYNQQCLKITILFQKKLLGYFDLLYIIIINSKGICIHQKITIMQDQVLFQLQPFKRKLLTLKIINFIKKSDLKYSKIIITNENLITVHLPKTQLNKNLIGSIKYNKKIQKSSQFHSYVQNIVNMIMQDSSSTLKSIFVMLTQIKIKQQNPEKQQQNKIKNMSTQLYRFLYRSPIQLRFDYTEGSAVYEKVIDIAMSEEKQIQYLIQNIQRSNELKLQTLRIFYESHDPFYKKYREAFYLNVKEKQMIKNLLDIPQIITQKSPHYYVNMATENKYLFNNIMVQHPFQGLRFLIESGFGRLEYGSFNFWYQVPSKIENDQNIGYNRQLHQIRNKYMIVKSPRTLQENKRDEQNLKFLAKHMHQIRIIRQLKGLSCVFIPRYYEVEGFYEETPNKFVKKDSPYRQNLFIEMINYENRIGYSLRNLITDSSVSLTFKKIIYIMGQVAQGLRFLHMNRIVHLDLKPENILIQRNFQIKIVDFGQSYHPNVKYSNTKPAFTYPYGCPQIAQENLIFGQKSDVFSFGVILFELIYGKDLITTSPCNLIQEYRKKNYLRRIFVTPEQNELFGEKVAFPILNYLIMRCIEPDYLYRPSMTWISVILKYVIQILI